MEMLSGQRIGLDEIRDDARKLFRLLNHWQVPGALYLLDWLAPACWRSTSIPKNKAAAEG